MVNKLREFFWGREGTITAMESIDFSESFIETNDNSLYKEILIGWSAACLNETISFYLDYNVNNINNEESDN